MRKTTRLLVATAALALLTTFTACGSEDGDKGSDTATESPAPTEDESGTPTPTEETPTEGTETPVAGTEELTQSAVDDLAKRLGVDASEIEVVDVEAVTWTDGSIGCAKADMIYTQALVEGTRITLSSGGKEYAYHSGDGADPSYCKKPTQ